MEVEAEIKKWGNSLALRISGAMAELPKLKAGTRVLVGISEEGLQIKKSPEDVAVRIELPYSEAQVLEGISPSTAHADEMATLSGSELEGTNG